MSLVSNNIKYLRKLNGLTQEQFARRIGIKRSLLGAYEEARANPNYNNLVAMAKAFNTTVDILLKQDLQRIRHTPELNLPLQNIGHPVSRENAAEPTFTEAESPFLMRRAEGEPAERVLRSPIIRDPMPPEGIADEPNGLQPQPLASVLEKYYREPSLREPSFREPTIREMAASPERDRPRPTERPTSERSSTRTTQAAQSMIRAVAQRIMFRPVSLTDGVTFTDIPQNPAPTRPDAARPDRVEQSRPFASPPAVVSPTFNNIYEQSVPVRPNGDEQTTQPAIPLVQQFQFGEYQQRYQQPDYLSRLPTLRLPTLTAGHYRAFEADADFSAPGALLIGQFVRNWFDIADGKLYVLLIQGQGPTCRRIFNQVKVKGTLLLTADKSAVPSREIALKDVLEVWEVKAFVSQQLPEPGPNLDRLRQLTDELRYEVDRLK